MNENLIYLIVESQTARLERIVKRFIIAFVIITICEVVGLLWYISLPVEEESANISSEDGNALYIGNDVNGDFNNGQNYSDEKEKVEETKQKEIGNSEEEP